MTAFTYKARFCQPIIDETKGGTIRKPRKDGRLAKVGGMLQFYTGPRMKPKKFTPDRECLGVEPIVLDMELGTVVIGVDNPDCEPMVIIGGTKMLDAFARFDGFSDWRDLRDFWDAEHGGKVGIVRKFDGFHTRWLDWPKALVP
jgi:hypothetical protein